MKTRSMNSLVQQLKEFHISLTRIKLKHDIQVKKEILTTISRYQMNRSVIRNSEVALANHRKTRSMGSIVKAKQFNVRITRMKVNTTIAKVKKDILTTIGRFQLNKNASFGKATATLVHSRKTRSMNSIVQLQKCHVRINCVKLKPIIANVEKDILTTIGTFQLNKNVSVGNASVISANYRYKRVQLKGMLLPAVKVKQVDAKGLGLFALESIRSDTIIGEYVGEIITQAEMSNRGDYTYALKYGPYYIDSRLRGNYTRFVNSSHKPNAAFKMVNVDGEKRSVLISLKDIKKDHEITADYGRFYGGECFCREENCTGKIGIYK